MTDTDVVRTSRDGDQFHYYWAAQRCLELLRPSTNIVSIAIEGPSRFELDGPGTPTAGAHVVDVAEYLESEDLTAGGRVIYRQLKHSTVQSQEPWTMSGLRKTLEGFASRFRELQKLQRHSTARFEFVSNRRVHSRVLQALHDVASRSRTPKNRDEVTLLRRYLALNDPDLEAEFCSAFVVDTDAPSLLPLIAAFEKDVASYLPGGDPEAVLKLKEAITRRATTLDKSPLTRADVFVALGTTEDAFLPAPSRLLAPAATISRAQYADLARKICDSNQPVIVHASGGVGKSVFAQQLDQHLPSGSIKITYDCYGLGSYRKSSEIRHEHRQGLVQIANELATLGLCQPLIQSAKATASEYSQAFLARVQTASSLLSKTASSGLLVLVVDAADNAVMAANEFNSGRPFPVDLVREDLPSNVRLVMLCRTERIRLLNPPPATLELLITGFNDEESKAHLESKFGPASVTDAQEFHKRTSGNPRVQAQVLDDGRTITHTLSILGESYLSPESAFEDLLDKWFARIRDEAGQDAAILDLMSQVLATLRPRIPTPVIAELSGASLSLVESFVSDIGRPLLLLGDAVQFRDEPTETWFRNNFQAAGAGLTSLVAGLRILAETSAYAATSLPQLLWEEGSFDELVKLALSEEALPNSNDIERQEIQQQRVQFALKAALRTEQILAASRLALKAGTLAAGHSRRLKMIRENTDLAGEFLDPQTIEDLVASRSLGSGWPGSNLAYEGMLMSVSESSRLDARNRLRSAREWMSGWSRLPSDRQRDHKISHEDIAELAMGRLNVDGAGACVEFLSRCRPSTVAFDVGTLIAGRLIERGELVRLNGLLKASESNKYLQLAITGQAVRQNVMLDTDASLVVMKTLRHHRNKIELSGKSRWDQKDDGLAAICGALTTCLKNGLISKVRASAILSKYLPAEAPRSLGSGFHQSSEIILKAWAVRTYLTGEALTDAHLADPELLDELNGKTYVSTRDGRGYRQNIAPLIPWVTAWARVSCEPGTDVDAELQPLLGTLPKPKRRDDDEPKLFLNVAAKLSAWLLSQSAGSAVTRKALQSWYQSVAEELWWPTTNAIIRMLAPLSSMDQAAFYLANSAHQQITTTREDAQERTDALIQLTRALHSLSPEESQHYFDAALDLADKVGDEIRERWDAMLAVSHQAGPGGDDEERAYKIAQLAEAVEPYMGDGFGYQETIKAVATLSARTAMSVASRWRDRRFGVFSEVLRGLLDSEVGALKQEHLPSLAFSPFHDRIALGPLVERAVLAEKELSDSIFDVAFDVFRMRGNHPEQSKHFVALAKKYGYPCGEYEAPRAESRSLNTSRDWFAEPLTENADAVEDSLASLDFTSAEDMEAGRKILRSARYDQRDLLLQTAFKQPPRTWSKIAKAFSGTAGFTISDYKSFFEISATLESPPAGFRNASGDLARHAAARFGEEIATHRWQDLPWDAIESLTGIKSPILLNLAFKEVGSRGGFLDSAACFALLTKLVRQLSADQARLVLDDAINHIQYLVEPGTADGPWTERIAPPAQFSDCIAGYIWARLGDPDVKMRWRAAHAVRILCQLQSQSELKSLAVFAMSGQATGFVDNGLVFYAEDALLWLVMALDRAATADAEMVVDFIPLLFQLVESGNPHLLIRDRVDAIIRKLNAKNPPVPGAPGLNRLSSVRPEPLVLEYQDWNRPERSRYEKNIGGYDFDYDFRDHWIAPLANCFGLDALDVEQKAATVIQEHWAGQYQGSFEEDERWKRKIFEPGETHTYRGERPKLQDLNSYLSFHALFMVAGELSVSLPAYQEPYSQHDEFSKWLESWTLTRVDGRWLSDRRDADPRRTSSDLSVPDDQAWRWSVAADDFILYFSSDESRLLTVWEESAREERARRQDVKVHTALVDRSRSIALMAALQTADSPFDFLIPDAGDESEIDSEGYILRGWIDSDPETDGIDKDDPFGEGIDYPPPYPSAEVQELLGLVPDADMRFWRGSGGASDPDLVVSTWNDLDSQRYGRGVGGSGVRVQIRPETLEELLERLSLDLIAKVAIDRKTFDYSGKRTDDADHGMGYIDEYFKIFVYRAGGGWYELRPNDRPR